ncbi:MAG: glycosyltransferase family 4 protein [Desulfobacterales bacterium]|nr:glycosyltransferase family 4 protein [Desulfobacterales bacterium]
MPSSITVLLVSSSYPQSAEDWKSIFIRQFLYALSDKINIKINYWGPPGPLPKNVFYACLPQEGARLSHLMSNSGIIHLFRQRKAQFIPAIINLLISLNRTYRRQKGINIFHVNWLQNALPLWGTRHPAVISVLGSDLGLLKLPGMTWLLRQVIKKRQCVLAPNAEWMETILVKKFGDIARVVFIPLGIDKKWYEVQRDYENISPRIWLAISRLTQKKIGHLLAWGEKKFNMGSGHQLHLFGPMQEEVLLPEWVFYHGPTHAQDLLENWFPKATGLVTLSQHDEGRPQVILEAMAAGISIIASRIPAHENFISHRKTGWLSSSEEEFFEGIDWVSVPENNKNIAAEAKRWVSREIGTWSDCVEKYSAVYSSLLLRE